MKNYAILVNTCLILAELLREQAEPDGTSVVPTYEMADLLETIAYAMSRLNRKVEAFKVGQEN